MIGIYKITNKISEKIYEDCAYTVTSSVEPFGKVTEVTVIVCKPLDYFPPNSTYI